MSLLYKRRGSPNYYVTKTRESTGTSSRRLAEEFARKSLEEHWRVKSLGVRRLWKDLVKDWLDLKSGSASLEQDQMVIARFGDLLAREGKEMIDQIDGELVQDYARVVKAHRSPATANRHLTTIRAMLNHAKNKGWLDNVPTLRNYPIPTREPKWLTREQVAEVAQHLPEWCRDMFLFGVQTGMRYSNIAGLKWEWVRGSTAVVPAIQTKSGKTYTIPLSKEALAIVSKAKALKTSPYVFNRPGFGSPIPCVRHWWEIARSKAGLPHTWHEATRHTWASWHVQSGKTPLMAIKAMGGWSSLRMVEVYGHLAPSHLEAYADNLNLSE